MCGIAGYYGQGDIQILKKMTRTLRHRGPDDEGFFVDNRVGLGQRRLSVIDLSPLGHQPMSNENESIWISFNGEIYNYKKLRKLLKNSHKFKSSTDTEVILHLYEEIGDEVFSKLEGMFAIAIYDKNKNILFLARDRMGKKPLYYARYGDDLIFASELKALHQHPKFEKKINKLALKSYLFYEYVPTPLSIFENVYKLEPATYLKIKDSKISKKRFWRISFDREKKENLNINKAVYKIGTTIEEAVKDRLVSDAPLGVLLSGGLDSSAILYYAQKNSQKKIKTFSIGFKEASFDESKYARQVAKHLGSEHFEKIFSASDSLGVIDSLGDILDEPMADQSILPTYLLSKFTRKNVTVALGGDGGDEIFAGYDTFIAHKLSGFYEKIPRKFRKKVIEKLMINLPTSFSNISLDFKIKSFIKGFDSDKKYRDARWMSSFDLQEKNNIFSDNIRVEMKKNNELDLIDNYVNDFPEIKIEKDFDNYFRMITILYLRMYMMDQVMVKIDRASMANSLETRAPLLDSRVVDLALSLPVNYKLRPLSLPYVYETKYIFKKLMQDKIPNNIVWRKKKGFGVPMAEWLNGPLKELIDDKLSRKKIEEQALFDYNYIVKLIKEHRLKKKDNRKPIWTLLMFQIWYDKWM